MEDKILSSLYSKWNTLCHILLCISSMKIRYHEDKKVILSSSYMHTDRGVFRSSLIGVSQALFWNIHIKFLLILGAHCSQWKTAFALAGNDSSHNFICINMIWSKWWPNAKNIAWEEKQVPRLVLNNLRITFWKWLLSWLVGINI